MSFTRLVVTGGQSHCNLRKIGSINLDELALLDRDKGFMIDDDFNVYQGSDSDEPIETLDNAKEI